MLILIKGLHEIEDPEYNTLVDPDPGFTYSHSYPSTGQYVLHKNLVTS